MWRLLLICAAAVSAAAAPAPRDHAPVLNTLASGWDSLVTPTYEWVNVFCPAPTLDGIPLEPGDTIFVYDPDGILAGIDTVRADGSFGFTPVYRDDAFSDADEGFLPGDTLHFALSGRIVVLDPPVTWTANGDKFEACNFVSTAEFMPVHVDIKPGSCPNPFSLNGNLDAGKSVLPVAVLGAADFDVRDIDPATITLAGAEVVRWSYEDVSRPKEDPDDTCACHNEGGDGYGDLNLKFYRADIAPALEPAADRDFVALVLEGRLKDGSLIRGADCVRVQRNVSGPGNHDGPSGKTAAPAGFSMTNHPNPFNPSTTISFTLPAAGEISLRVFDVRGRLVRTLAAGRFDAGTHTVVWDGTDGGGNRVASGVYFYRLVAENIDRTAKMLLMK